MGRASLMQRKSSARGNQLALVPFKGEASTAGKYFVEKTNEAGAEEPAGVNPFARWRSCRAPQQIVEHFSTAYMAEVPW